MLNIYHLLDPNCSQKLKVLIIYWNLVQLTFQISRSRFWYQKIICRKYLQHVRPKLVSKLKMHRIYWNLNISDILNILILILMCKLIFIKYLPLVWPKLVPKLKVLRFYWNLAHLIFQIFWSRFRCQTLFSLNTYHLLGSNWSQNLKCSKFIEVWHIWYFEYPNFDFNVKTYFN